jgi:hypothetical protein
MQALLTNSSVEESKHSATAVFFDLVNKSDNDLLIHQLFAGICIAQ